MKRGLHFLSILLMTATLAGCGNPRTICGTTYDTYGILNADDKKNPDIEYRVSWGSVILGIILFETIVAPVYFFGFDLFEPVGTKQKIKGAIPPIHEQCDTAT